MQNLKKKHPENEKLNSEITKQKVLDMFSKKQIRANSVNIF
jgi:hypothetical protein